MADRNETLIAYVSDMHALEHHMLEAFEAQLDITSDTPEAHKVVQQLVNSTRQHIGSLEQRLKALGEAEHSIADTIKSAVSAVFGMAAGAIDMVRPQSVSKALRDSYTASNLAIISYVMLQTTGEALDDSETARLAERHLGDCISNIQAIAKIMPDLVVKDLSDDVGTVSMGATTKVTGNKQAGFLFGGDKSTSVGA